MDDATKRFMNDILVMGSRHPELQLWITEAKEIMEIMERAPEHSMGRMLSMRCGEWMKVASYLITEMKVDPGFDHVDRETITKVVDTMKVLLVRVMPMDMVQQYQDRMVNLGYTPTGVTLQ